MKKLYSALLIGSFILAACSTTDQSSVTPFPIPASPQPTVTAVKIVPTPSSPGDSILWDTLQVTMDQFEVNQEYLTDFGSTRTPPNGNKFLWVHIKLQNTGQTEMDVPVSEHFSILYAAIELKPTYGHRAEYTDYTTLGSVIFPGQLLDGWLRFDIPITAKLSDLQLVFLPESSQVGASYNSPDYPYADDKPTYVWEYAP